MRVNSTFTSYFTHRLVMRSAITVAMLAIFFIASSFTKHSDRDLRAKQANIIVRQIGHRLMLQAGDSTSRVLPVTEINEGTFLLEFENEFVFSHDSLMLLSQSLFSKTQFPSGYTVTVHECLSAIIVYGFQINNTSPDILACKGRSQPSGCYTIEVAFPDLYANIEQKKADIGQQTEELKQSKVGPQEAQLIPIAIGTEEQTLSKVVPQDATPIPIAMGTEELKSLKVNSQKASSKIKEFKTRTLDYPIINLVSGMLVLLSVALLIGRFGKSPVPVPVQNQNHSIIKESGLELTALGKFLFDVKDQRLLLGSEVVSLTDKECRILELLNNNFGELISRETLMQKVWINDGVITGRSLDMFVSKLRKKLSGDPELRITNVHGKGYKLEIPGV